MKPASCRQWGEFGPHIPIRPVSKAILHNAAQRTAAEQDFDFPQCDSNFIFPWKATWLPRLGSRDEQWRAIHKKMLVWSFTCNFSKQISRFVEEVLEAACLYKHISLWYTRRRPLLLDPWCPPGSFVNCLLLISYCLLSPSHSPHVWV